MKVISKTQIQRPDAEVLLGQEWWPINGHFMGYDHFEQIIKKMKGLKRNWDCLEKAMIVKEHFGYGCVVLGSAFVFSKNMESNFGYDFRPPLEFHAWWRPTITSPIIVDVALPGLIEQGLNSSDEYGPFIGGRQPVVLAGIPDHWMNYQDRMILKEV